MDFLQALNIASFILTVLSLYFTMVQIFKKALIRKYKEKMINELISLMERQIERDEILRILTEEGYSEYVVSNKYNEIQELMRIRA